ncbi:MAG: HAMP domain-containing sensor histidine kinase [Bacteroidota bacterium]
MNKLLEKIIGREKEYELQHRILNASMFLAVILSLMSAISNYALGLTKFAILVSFAGLVLFIIIYIISIYAKEYKLVAIFGLGTLAILYIPLIWYTNDGSNGSTPYVIIIVLIAILTITKGSLKVILVSLLAFTTIALHIVEYYYPEFLIPYPNRTGRYSDLIIAFLIAVFGAIAYINIYFNAFQNANKKLNKKNNLLEKKQEEIQIQQDKIELQKQELEKKARDLQEANRTKDRFFTIIAHDLQSPFNTLIGFSELIEQEIENKDLEEIEKINQIILQSSTQAHRLLLNLLEWSKAQTNQIECNPEKFDIQKVINEQAELFKYQANKKHTNLIDESNHCYVFADLNLINTVLRNLISNAVKYTQGGSINIKSQCNSSHCIISIQDTGAGISKEKLEKLFYVGENTSTLGTNGEKGTGLGLILCKEFVEKNNGEIFVESRLNKGSIFSFNLPLYEDEL